MKKWSNLEDEYLKLNVHKKSLSRLSKETARSKDELTNRLKHLNVDAKKRVWDQEEIVEEIKRLHQGGEKLNIQNVIRNYKELVAATYRKNNFTCWEEAIKASGLDYNEIRKVRRWDKDSIIMEIQNLAINEVNINSKNIQDNYPQLRSAAFRHFGSWRQAVMAAGINYSEIKMKVTSRRKSRKWNSENVLEAIREIETIEGFEGLTSNNVWKNHKSLYNAACYYFNNWAEAVEKAGFQYDNIRLMKRWTKEKIIHTIQKLHEQDVPLNITNITQIRYDLYKAGRNQFGSWRRAINEAGLSYSKVRLNKKRRRRKSKTTEED